MKVVSVNVGAPREVAWNGQQVRTGIFKESVGEAVAIRRLGVEGDGQADTKRHGGPLKAVYAYPSEHYAFWRRVFPELPLPWGALGENLTTEGLAEEDVHIGDRFQVGAAELVVTQPRMPCCKLGLTFDAPSIVRTFARSGLCGFYLGVEQEGQVAAGDVITQSGWEPHRVTVADIFRFLTGGGLDRGLLERALQVRALPGALRTRVQHALDATVAGESPFP